MKDKTILVIFLYAIISLAALVVVPTLAYTIFDFVGFAIGLVIVLAGIWMTRPLFMTEARALLLIASLSIISVVAAWAGMLSLFPALVEWGNQTKNTVLCAGDPASIWCRLPDLVMPSATERWAICGIITIVIVVLNAIWFITRKDQNPPSKAATAPSGDIIGNSVKIGGNNEVPNVFGHNNVIGVAADEQPKSASTTSAAASGDVRDNSVEIGGDNKQPNIFGHGNIVGSSADKDSPKAPAGKKA